MKIVLADINHDVLRAWQCFCGDLPDVTIYPGSILDLRVDAVVSPANSFGFMDGGIDLVYLNRFGIGIQQRVQDRIKKEWHGEMPVGLAFVLATKDEMIDYLIVTPTMRVPMRLPENTINPYLATKAVFHLVQKPECPIESIAFPGMGTGVGGVDPRRFARQMRAAIEEVVLGKFTFPETWLEAQDRHNLLSA